MSEAGEEKIYTAEEIEKHTDRDDLWMVINGKVYDVSGFVDEHPGGEEVLVDVAGKDATSEFEDVGHSEDADEILSGLLLGKADPESFNAKKASAKAASVDGSVEESSGAASYVYMVVAALVAAGAYFYLA